MALALDCVCPDSGAAVCAITKLEWVITKAGSTLATPASLELLGGPYTVTLSTWTAQRIDLGDPTPWLAAWDSLYFSFAAARSIASDDIDSAFAVFYLEATYSCGDGGDVQTMRAYNNDLAQDVCSPDGGLTVYALGSIGQGGVSGFIRHTRPLDPCYGFSVTGGHMGPAFDTTQTVDIAASAPGSLVLCPSGGSSPYFYGIRSGTLPGGMTLNASTGEITGTPDGSSPGSPEVEFYVYDGAHNYATVTCAFLLNCTTTVGFGNSMF